MKAEYLELLLVQNLAGTREYLKVMQSVDRSAVALEVSSVMLTEGLKESTTVLQLASQLGVRLNSLTELYSDLLMESR